MVYIISVNQTRKFFDKKIYLRVFIQRNLTELKLWLKSESWAEMLNKDDIAYTKTLKI